jgi:hypothetical protein
MQRNVVQRGRLVVVVEEVWVVVPTVVLVVEDAVPSVVLVVELVWIVVLAVVRVKVFPTERVTGTVITWSSDPDGDPLTFDVFLMRDGGAAGVSLQPLMVGVSSMQTARPAQRMPSAP